jgi:4-hydroxy-3-polyprenylbenzoate decarboxylase
MRSLFGCLARSLTGGKETIKYETDQSATDVFGLADFVYDNRNVGAKIASGGFKTDGMIIAPCSMKSLAGINCGYSDNLMLRAADVCLKERRQLVLVARECPLSAIHLRNMYELTQAGAVILPPMLEYYSKPQSVEEVTNHIVGKILDRFGIDCEGFNRWNG